MQSVKARFEETVGAMSKQLMDFVEKMNNLEQECVSFPIKHFKSTVNIQRILF